MVFGRRIKPGLIERLRRTVLPPGGWRRALRYLWHRIARLPGSPTSIAVGFASGAAVSILPTVGFHFVLGALLAWALRGNLIASAIGTLLGNPWTFPVVWVGTYELGAMLLGQPDHADSIHFASFFAMLWETALALDWHTLVRRILPIWGPMMVGSLPVALVTWLVTYALVRRAVTAAQHARHHRRTSRLGRPPSLPGPGGADSCPPAAP